MRHTPTGHPLHGREQLANLVERIATKRQTIDLVRAAGSANLMETLLVEILPIDMWEHFRAAVHPDTEEPRRYWELLRAAVMEFWYDAGVPFETTTVPPAQRLMAWLVAQDWGAALAFYLAARRPSFVRGLAFMEFIRPMPTWDDFHRPQMPERTATFRKFRTPGEGERMILEGNAFIERVLPGGIIRKLNEQEMAVYRAPFPAPQSRRPIWRLPNELPIAGEPADVHAVLERAHAALTSSRYPKLLFAGNPGALVSPAFAESFAARLCDCRLVQLGAGAHYLQEDHPETIGRSVAAWIAEIERAAGADAA